MLFGGLIIIVVGSVLLAAAVFFVTRTRRFLETALSANGTVMGFIESSGSEGGSTYKPVVAFTTAQGQNLTFTDQRGVQPTGIPAGPGGDGPV